MRRRRVSLLITAALAVSATACSDDTGDGSAAPTTSTPPGTTTPATSTPPAGTEPPTATSDPTAPDSTAPATAPSTAPATMPAETRPAFRSFQPGTEQVTIVSHTPEQHVELVTDDGTVVARGTTDANGALLFRGLEGGLVVTAHIDGRPVTDPVKVMSRGDQLDPSIYQQVLTTNGTSGHLNYIITRDRTPLSASVWLPGPASDGPYPTVVEYSGYTPSNPDSQGFPQMLTALGYAYVGVNMRGTGCSGGSFRYFEYTQSLDGYDVIETVANQPWVEGHRVGMVGVSYPGISQLFVAQTQPPSLAAITPLSVIADTYKSTLYPGGILNTGFAVEWAQDRVDEARAEGQRWAARRIADGDEACAANQNLRLQNPDLVAEIAATPYWSDSLGPDLAPRLFVDRIEVPVFLAGAWQDEQTGGQFATMLDRFTGTPHLYATLVNGLHTESLSPSVFDRFVEFLDLYVAERVPSLAAARAVAPILASGLFFTTDVALPSEDRFAGMTYEQALAAFEAEPAVRVLFEQGAAEGYPARAPMAAFQAEFDAWPVPSATTRWYLGDGALTAEPPAADAPASTDYLALPDATPPTFFSGGSDSIWSVYADYDWQQGAPGTYAGFVTAPLAEDTTIVGSGSADLWIEANGVAGGPVDDTDLEVTISEVRPGPDGAPVEVYVQSGWLRASHRALDDEASTELLPVHTDREADAAPLPAGEPTLVRVELFPFAHVFRAGSQIRVTIDAPGGNRAVWEFATISGGERVTLWHDADHPSSIVLPVVDLAELDVAIPDYPAPDALRGQPSRAYVP